MKKRSDLLVFGAIVTVLVLVVCTALLGSDPADNPEPGAAAGVQATVEARLVATLTPTSTAIRTDCDDERFVERILKMSGDNQDPLAPRILKVYSDAEELERTDSVLRCKGTAVLNRGGEAYVTYHHTIDRDGDTFIGYEIGEAIPTTTPIPVPIPTPDLAAMVATVTAQVEAEHAATATAQAQITPTPPPIGTTVEAGGSAYTVNEVLDPAPTGGRGVEAGKRLVAIDITQTGIADGDSYNTFDFFVQDADGYVYGTGFGYTGVEPRIGSGELAAGQRVRGWVTIQVPASAVLVSVLVAAEGFGPKILIADLMAGQPSVASEPAPTPTIGPDTTPAELVERVKDGVVRVTAGSSSGSGFIFATVGDTAFVVTNHHVIEDADAIDVTVKDARTYPATLLGFNSDKDVAVLAICCDSGFVVLHWESGPAPALSTPVIAIGYPRSAQTGVVATTGEIAGPDSITRQYDVIAHTAPLNPGNSGGPLLSMDGRVLGINVGSSTFEHEAVYYAVPYATIEQQIADWKSRLVVAP